MSRDVTLLHPYTRMLGEALEQQCAKVNLNIKITDCFRTKTEQNSIGASRTNAKYPYSFHNWGLAFDICQNDRNCPYPSDNEWWEKVITIGERLGLDAGGHWKGFVDKPHFQLDAYGTCENLIKTYGSPKGFTSHKDYKVTTPGNPITPLSSFKKILWLQVRLSILGYRTKLTGVWDNNTIKSLKAFWKDKTGKKCTGKLCSLKCIKYLK